MNDNVVNARLVEQGRPFFAGRCFDDTYYLPAASYRLLIERGLVYVTSFTIGDISYAGLIIAASWDQARQIARQRKLGEAVDGLLGGRADVNGEECDGLRW
jgi:hypothetical protein